MAESTTTTTADSGDQPPPPPPPSFPNTTTAASMISSAASSASMTVTSAAASAAAVAGDFGRFLDTLPSKGSQIVEQSLGLAALAAASAAGDIANATASVAAAANVASNISKEKMDWLKKEQAELEERVFGKIKEGVVEAIEHPVLATSATVVASLLLFKKPRSFLIQNLRSIFVSKEDLLSSAQNEVTALRQTVNLVSNENRKLMERANAQEKKFQKGWNTLLEESRAIQHELGDIRDIEDQAAGLKCILNDLPRAQASELRQKVSEASIETKNGKRALNAALSKIINHGVPI